MRIRAVCDWMDAFAPPETAADYDNVGLLLGDDREALTGVVLSLDCTRAALQTALRTGANLILTHHPIIFHPLKSVTADALPYALLRAGISVFAAHTNLDKAAGGVNDCLAAALGLQDVRPFGSPDDPQAGRIGSLPQGTDAAAFATAVQAALGGRVRYTGEGKIRTVAVCSGSGADLLPDARNAGADAFVTGDVKHAALQSAAAQNFILLDAGHFETEDVMLEPLCARLRAAFPTVSFCTVHESGFRTL